MTQSEGVLTPKFLTKEIARAAVKAAYKAVFDEGGELYNVLQPRRHQCHIVILVPGMIDHVDEDYPEWPNYPTRPVLLYEETFLDGKGALEGPYDDIARCKALQLWTGRNDDRTDIVPHLLFKGDAPFWGGVKRRGLVVTCSGVQPWIDKLISGMVADMLVSMAHADWKREPDTDFLT